MNTYGETEKEIIGCAREIIGVRCDNCKKIIFPKSETCKENLYYKITTGHHDWGNDSIDSIKHFDLCQDCLNDFVAKKLDGNQSKSSYMDISTEHIYPNRYEKYREVVSRK